MKGFRVAESLVGFRDTPNEGLKAEAVVRSDEVTSAAIFMVEWLTVKNK